MVGPPASPVPGPAVAVTAWIGSANAGDELVHAGLRRLLAARGVAVTTVSLDPAATVARYGGHSTSRARAVLDLAARRRLHPLLLGGGGLLQDETSAVNLPYHLLPVAAARAQGVAVAGVGLGAGPISGPAARRLVAAGLQGVELAVRDQRSADAVASLGLPMPAIAADLALELPDPPAQPAAEVLAVALRPWDGRRHRLPVALRARAGLPAPAQVACLAAAVDAVARRLDLAVRFVAFDRDKDDALHRAVAERLQAEVVDVLAPDPSGALLAVAGSCVVLAMRYHAGVAALLGRRPTVLLGYSAKVEALAADVGAGFVATSPHVPVAGTVGDAADRAVGDAADGVLDAALGRLRSRGAANGAVLDRLLEGPRP